MKRIITLILVVWCVTFVKAQYNPGFQSADRKYIDFMYKPNYSLRQKVIEAQARNTYLKKKAEMNMFYQELNLLYKMFFHSYENKLYTFSNQFQKHLDYAKKNQRFYNLDAVKELENNYIQFLKNMNRETTTSKEKSFNKNYIYTTTFDNPPFKVPLRSEPSLNSTVRYECPKNATVKVIDNTGEIFYKVIVNGYSGYVSKKLLKRQF